MARAVDPLSEPDLERQLLRRSVGTLSADRDACADCGRIPLVGERYDRYAQGQLVCALCSAEHPGSPQASELQRHSERGLTVRIQDRRQRVRLRKQPA